MKKIISSLMGTTAIYANGGNIIVVNTEGENVADTMTERVYPEYTLGFNVGTAGIGIDASFPLTPSIKYPKLKNTTFLFILFTFLFAASAFANGIVNNQTVLWHNSSTGAVKYMPINNMIPEETITVTDSSNLNLIPKGIVDFDSDGIADILVHNQNTGMARAWIMDRNHQKTDNIALLESSNTNLMVAGVGDFDQDGDSDIATFNANTGTLIIWVMEGTTKLRNETVLRGANLNLVPRGVGDMDGDGIPDIILRNANSGAVRVWTMNGDFTRKGNEYVTGSSNTNLELRGIMDINGDGNNDILNYNTTTGKLRAWLMNGSLGIIENPEIIQETNLGWSVRSGYSTQITEVTLAGTLYIEEPSIVNILFSALDQNGHAITNLLEDDFIIKENGESISTRESFFRIVKHDAEVEENVLFLLDVSTSITYAQLATMKQTLKDYINNSSSNSMNKLNGNIKIAIKTFGEVTNDIVDYTNNKEKLLSAIDSIIITEPTTNLYGAFINAIDSLKNNYTYNELEHGTLVLMTDGKDQAGTNTLAEAITAKADNSVFVIHVDSDEDDPTVSEALATKNKVYGINDFSEVTQALEKLNSYLKELSKGFYYLRYATPKRAGIHEVTVSVGDTALSGTFNADGFSSVRPELIVEGSEKFLAKNVPHVMHADILWTLQENLDAETYTWTSSDSSILNIISSNNGEVTVEFLTNGNASLNLHADLHNLDTSVDFSNMNPVLVGTDYVYGPNGASDIEVKGDYAYVVTFDGFKIIDIKDPASPILVGSYAPTTTPYSRNIAISGNYAYLTSDYGLQIINISNPASPILISSYSDSEAGDVVTVNGNYAYIATGNDSVFDIIDISDPASPLFVNTSEEGGSSDVTKITIVGNYAYASNPAFSIKVYDISSPSLATYVNYGYVEQAISDTTIDGDYAYVVGGLDDEMMFSILDISSPSSPNSVGSPFNIPDTPVPNEYYVPRTGSSKTVAISGNYAYVDIYTGVKVIDISDPIAPAVVGNIVTMVTDRYFQGAGLTDISIIGDYAYITGGSLIGLGILDISKDYFTKVPSD